MNTLPKQLMLVGAVVMTFIAIAAIALFSQGSGSLVPSEATSKQYTVEKSRTSARGIASSDREVEGAEKQVSRSQPVRSMTPDAKPEVTRIQVPVKTNVPVEAPEHEQKEPSVESIIAESFSADSTQAAMDVLARAIADAQSPDDTSRLYGAIGSLQLAQTNPDSEAGLAALRSATESATSKSARSHAAVAEANALMLHGENETSLARIEELLDDGGIETESGHHLTLMHGDLLVEKSDIRAAEAEYERVRQATTTSNGAVDPLFRQASLRLARLYARTGEKEKEATIARDLERTAKTQ